MKLIRRFTLALACAALAASTHPAIAARGDLDLSFNPSVNHFIGGLALQADGKILILGGFTEVGEMARSNLARLHADGTLDLDFHFNVDSFSISNRVSSIAVQADGKIVIGGRFASVGEVARTNLARLEADGTLDLGFNPAVDGGPIPHVDRIVVQTDGKILIGARFTVVNGVARNSLARLNADGTLDMDFHPMYGTSSEQLWVFDMALQPDGKILVFGRLLKMDGTYRHYFVRLNSDGTLDTGFNVNTDDEVEALALQADGKILIAGDFYLVGGVVRLGLARLNADGTLDSGFAPVGDYESVITIAAQTDGKTLVSVIDDDNVTRLVQLNANGELDPDFNANVTNSVSDIAIQADGKILIAGSFTSVSGISRTYIARLLGQPANEVSLGRLSVANGLPGFDIASVIPRTVIVEASTNLVHWIGIQSIPIAIQPVRFSDPNHPNFPSRLYRLSWQPEPSEPLLLSR